MKADVVGVIEATYAEERDDAAWVRRLAEVSAPALDRGLGVFAAMYDAREDSLKVGPAAGVGSRVDELIDVFRAVNAMSPPGLLDVLYRRGPAYSSGQDQARMTNAAYHAQACIQMCEERTGGICDAMGVVSGNPEGIGCIIVAPSPERPSVPRWKSEQWTRIAAHLAAAVRMRQAPAQADEVDAVLSPDGRVEHAEPLAKDAAARDALSNGAKRIDRSRGTLRRNDPDEAVEIWRALVAGRWSLVEHFDHDGRRYLLARRNEPAARTMEGLTLLEREAVTLLAMGHTNKLIAYQLGLTPSGVAMRLSRAAAKVGAKSRVELIAMCAGGGRARRG
jgi:DNA-binding CsgD family transcriptional regulator